MSQLQTIEDEKNNFDWEPGNFCLRDGWFAIANSPQVTNRPVRRKIYSQPYYLWRESGKLRVTEFHPVSFTAKRSYASEFTGGTGEYPVIERYGFIWVWYGNADNAHPDLMPDVPFLPRDRILPNYMTGTFYYHCTNELFCENLLDMTHADFVHASIVAGSESESDEVEVQSTSETVLMIRRVKKRKAQPVLKELGVIPKDCKYQDVDVHTHVHIRTGLIQVHSHVSPGAAMPNLQANIPESRFCSRVNYAFNGEYSENEAHRKMWPGTSNIVAAQDIAFLDPQNPRYLHEKNSPPDLSTRFDRAGLQYRARFKALVKRQKEGDFSYQSDWGSMDVAKALKLKRIN